MTWQEFEKEYIEEGGDKAQLEVLQEVHWSAIEQVYAFHPAFNYSSVVAKKQIAKLVVQLGVGVIYAMQKEAQIAKSRDDKRARLRENIARMRNEIEKEEREVARLNEEDLVVIGLWNLKKDGDKK